MDELIAPIPSHETMTVSQSKQLLQSVFTQNTAAPELEPSKEDYRVRLQNFEGPLDLLLHLIKKEQIDIYDIPVSHICQSYLEYLDLMKQFDVNIAGDFMVMAATLTYLKSLELIPKDEALLEAEEDPRIPLVQQLLEYQRYKEAAEKIHQVEWLYRDIYPRSSEAIQRLIPKEVLNDAPLAPIDTFQLLVCLKASLDRTERKPLEIKFNTLSLSDKVKQFSVALAESEHAEFSRFTIVEDHRRRTEIVMTFLAILELAKLKFIRILQHENFGPIQLIRVRPLTELDLGMLDAY